MKNFSEIIKILMKIKDIHSEAKLAKILNLSPQAFNERKNRDSVPVEKIIDFCERECISLDWLLFGKGEQQPAEKEITLKDVKRTLDKIESLLKKK